VCNLFFGPTVPDSITCEYHELTFLVDLLFLNVGSYNDLLLLTFELFVVLLLEVGNASTQIEVAVYAVVGYIPFCVFDSFPFVFVGWLVVNCRKHDNWLVFLQFDYNRSAVTTISDLDEIIDEK